MKLRISTYVVAVIVLALSTGCESVRPYQRIYLNDHEMKPGQPETGRFEEQVQVYREGASGGGTSKTSGGCGCN